jgi:hypothetical protein
MPYRPRRVARVLEYFFFTAGGLVGAFEPSTILTSNLTSWLIYGWVLSLLIGAGLCLAGSVRNSWLGEYIGLPLMIFALGGYGLLAFGTALYVNPAALLGSFLYIAVGLGLTARLAEVGRQRKSAIANRPPRK